MTQRDSLEEVDARLRSLPATLTVSPDDSQAIAWLDTVRVHHESRHRRPVRLALALAVALAVIVVSNLGAAYYSPRYGRALAEAPIVGAVSGRMLQAVGLNDRNVTLVNDASVASGHEVRLVGGYADGLRTVLLVEIDGKGLTGDPKAYGLHPGEYGLGYDGLTLTDQFGHTYNESGVGGPTDISLEPLVWPASTFGARLTLHVTNLQALWLMGPGSKDVRVGGSWTLHATLVAEGVHSLALPAPIRTTNAVYKFTSVQATATNVRIHWTISGAPNEQMHGLIDGYNGTNPVTAAGSQEQQRQLSQAYFFPRLFDAAGKEMLASDWGTEYPKGQSALGDLNVFIHGPGPYRLQLGNALPRADDQRWIQVP